MATEDNNGRVLALAAQIVAAHVSNNTVAPDALPALIRQVHQALASAGRVAPEPEKPQPAVPIKKSVFPDYIVCLEDGKKLKMLKRHLQSAYNLTPDEYRARWGLPSDYPMVAPNYAERRSTLAREIGLGRKDGRPAAPPAEAAEEAPAARRGRRRTTDKD
jgi:predicted transcriptional regulator